MKNLAAKSAGPDVGERHAVPIAGDVTLLPKPKAAQQHLGLVVGKSLMMQPLTETTVTVCVGVLGTCTGRRGLGPNDYYCLSYTR